MSRILFLYILCTLGMVGLSASAQAADVPPINANDHVRGNTKAPVQLIVYTDLECPFCKTFHETLGKVMADYESSGEVAWAFRHFPLEPLFPNSHKIAEASECVAELGGNSAFFTFVDLIFNGRSTHGSTDMARLPTYAQMSGVPVSAFSACLSSGKFSAQIAKSVTSATNAGAQGTPHTIILTGGQSGVLNGAQPYEIVTQIIQNLLAQKQLPSTSTATIDLKVNGKDTALSFSGKKKLSLKWKAQGVNKKCFIYVAQGKSYAVAPVGSKKITVDSSAPYVSFNCNETKTGNAISDKILITDPRGTIALHISLDDARPVRATAVGHVAKPVCVGQFFGTIRWGDGTSDKVGPEITGSQCSTDLLDTQTHHYSETGTYRLTFIDKFKRKKVSIINIH